MSNIVTTEKNRDQHKWWHAWVPNFNVSFETKKYISMNITTYTCYWCEWKKVVTQTWDKG